jgi:two-component system, cell cycle sensor histidine kinase and response regulator CckA
MKDEEKSRQQLIHDVTKLRHRVAELEESEAKYRLVVESASEAICIIRDGVLKFCNPSGIRLAGYADEELLSKPFAELIHPDDLEVVSRTHVARLRGEYEPPGLRFRITASDGAIKWVESFSASITWEGQPAVLSMIRDVTRQVHSEELLRQTHDQLDRRVQEGAAELQGINEKLMLEINEHKRTEEALRRSEEKYRLVVENANEGIFLTQDGKPIFVNPMCSLLTGYSANELISQPFEQLIHPDDRQMVSQRYAQRLAGDQTSYSYRFRILTKDGSVKWVQLNSVLLGWENRSTVLGLLTDVTDRVQAEERLWLEKQRFQTLSDNAPMGLVMIGSGGSFEYINQKFSELFGYDLRDVPDGRSWFRLAFPDLQYRKEVISQWVEDIGRCQQGETRPRPFTVTCKDGTRKAIHFRPVQLETGEHLLTCEDITDRTNAEQAIQDRERFLSSVFASIQDGISILDTELNVIRVNPTMERWYSHAVPMTGKKCYEAYHSSSKPCDSCPSMRTLNTGQTAYEMVPKRGPSGEVTGWLDLYSFPLIDESTGERKGVIEYVRDISERKAAEEALRESETKYRTILETIADGYHEVDLAGNLTLVNDSTCEIFGYPREELLGVNYRKLMDEHSAKSVFEAYNGVYRTGKPNPGTNYRNVRKDGSRRDVSVSISLIKDADGQPRGFRGIIRDVTLRKRLQEQLYQASKMEALGTLAGGIAHDFNNLLQIVQGYTDLLLLRKHKEDPDYDKLRAMRGAAQRGRDLIQQILAFSRKVETKPRPVDLNNELRQTERLLRRTIEKMISIEMDLADNLWPISADPIHIEQILLNLAVNAKHAMPQGGRLMIETKNIKLDEEFSRTHLKTRPGRYVLLMVSDTGHGMDTEVLERIFEPFFTTKETGEGTGLGLAMVFGLVKSHDGHISCYSQPGVGTTFKIYFPAIDTECEWSAETTQEMPAFGSETLLIVDDEESIRELTKEILCEVGYKVLTTASGREAIDIYSKGKEAISLVILDLIMPEMDGKACLEELLKINPDVKILLASGYSANGPARQAIARGAKGLINKPYDIRQLLQMVREVLDAD